MNNNPTQSQKNKPQKLSSLLIIRFRKVILNSDIMNQELLHVCKLFKHDIDVNGEAAEKTWIFKPRARVWTKGTT